MNAEQVIDKILSQARDDAAKITSEAQGRIKEQSARLESELAEYRKQTQAMASLAGEDKKARMAATARMNIGKELLAAKNALLDEVFTKTAERLRSLDDHQHWELISSLMARAVETGDEEVIVGRNESRINQGFVDAVNGRLAEKAKGNLRMSADRADIEGGFILRKGRIRINASIAVLLDEARELLETELARELFAD